MRHSIEQELTELGIIDIGSVRPYNSKVRDREDIAVLRDEHSGVIYLDRVDHMDLSHYEQVEGGSYWGAKSREEALQNYKEDDERRAKQFLSMVEGKDVIDIGCGTGGLLDLWKRHTRSVAGVEPQAHMRSELERLGYSMYKIPSDAPKSSFDVATLFHVLEHITQPLATLREIRTLLRPGGTLIVEVPHARDVLLQLDTFKQFTLWSEHLMLHTKASLQKYLEAAGFKNIRIEGFQRYPLQNHLGWLLEGKPGGQKRISMPQEAQAKYAQMLVDSDQTDSLIATVTN